MSGKTKAIILVGGPYHGRKYRIRRRLKIKTIEEDGNFPEVYEQAGTKSTNLRRWIFAYKAPRK